MSFINICKFKTRWKFLKTMVKTLIVEKDFWQGIVLGIGQILGYAKPHLWATLTAISLSIVAVLKFIAKGSTGVKAASLNAMVEAIEETQTGDVKNEQS